MIRFLLQMLTALALVVGASIVAVVPAHAAPSTSVAQVSEVVKSAPNLSIPTVVAPNSASIPKSIVGGGGIKPAWLYVSCYRAMDGSVYCWRYACTFFETVALGCRDGWYRTSSTWYA